MKLWENINKLQRRNIKEDNHVVLYEEDNKLSNEEGGYEILIFWERLYQKHENKIGQL